jgi:hypothetical protein
LGLVKQRKQPRTTRIKNSHQFHELHEIAADKSGFVQLVEFAADSLWPPESRALSHLTAGAGGLP